MVRTNVQRVGRTCARRPYLQTHSRGKEKIQSTMVSCSQQSRQKMGLWHFDLIAEPLSWWQLAYTTNQENQLKSLSIQVNKDEYNEDRKFSPNILSPAPELNHTEDGNFCFHLQVPRGGTHLNGVGSELTFFYFCREASMSNLPWAQTEKDYALAKCRPGLRAWRAKKPMLCLHAVAHETVTLWKMKTNQAGGYVNIGVQSFRHTLKVWDTTNVRTSSEMFRKLLMTSAG